MVSAWSSCPATTLLPDTPHARSLVLATPSIPQLVHSHRGYIGWKLLTIMRTDPSLVPQCTETLKMPHYVTTPSPSQVCLSPDCSGPAANPQKCHTQPRGHGHGEGDNGLGSPRRLSGPAAECPRTLEYNCSSKRAIFRHWGPSRPGVQKGTVPQVTGRPNKEGPSTARTYTLRAPRRNSYHTEAMVSTCSDSKGTEK